MSCCCSPDKAGMGSSSGPLPLAITTVPVQPWEEPYTPCRALKTGTIFQSLDLPFYVTGGETNG
ncbi:MAG: spore coat associated protein CotJA [Hungatella sp.]|nr:spore coat associated protein CotJA [Hungatella sp.]